MSHHKDTKSEHNHCMRHDRDTRTKTHVMTKTEEKGILIQAFSNSSSHTESISFAALVHCIQKRLVVQFLNLKCCLN